MDSNQAVWNFVDTSYKAYLKAMSRFLSGDLDRVSVLKKLYVVLNALPQFTISNS